MGDGNADKGLEMGLEDTVGVAQVRAYKAQARRTRLDAPYS